MSHYSASKARINGFIRNAALEWAVHNVRINGVEPGMIRTPAVNNLGDEPLFSAIARVAPLKRLGKPEDIVHAMDGTSSYITGQILIVDGRVILPEISSEVLTA